MSWRLRPISGAWLLLNCLSGPIALGQAIHPPVVSSVFPPGATVGTSEKWTILGRDVAGAKTLLISGGGVEVTGFAVQGDGTASAEVRVAPDATPGFREVRLDGPGGLSNLVLVRIDTLPQQVEVEPNDAPDRAQAVAPGTAVVGILKAKDLDHFRIEGTPGRRLTIDLEARRIGSSISPVITLLSVTGEALAQGREPPGGDRDCRMGLVIPPGGSIVVQVRDNTYGGGDAIRYRLRVDPTPYATAAFPLGGPKGRAVEVEVSGGNLPGPLRKVVNLPETAGSIVEVGAVDGPGGTVVAPGRLVAGDGPEIVEPTDREAGPPIEVASGLTVNGRLARPGEVDAYRLPVTAGDKVRARVEAFGLGSWLDSVLVVRDQDGNTLAENDDTRDALRPDQARSVGAAGIPDGSPDSSIDYEAKADGVLTIELADRYGNGGPEYGYRLAIGPARPDFAVTLLLGNPNVNSAAIGTIGTSASARITPGQFGVFNLRPGSSTPINFIVAPEGRPGPIEVRAEGLPDGVSAEPISIRMPGPPRPGSKAVASGVIQPVADFLLLRVAPYASPGLGELRVVATARPEPGRVITREASATIGVDLSAVGSRPITRVISRFPIRIVGESRPRFVGPPAPPTLRKVSVPGPLLQGDRIDLALDFDRPVIADDGSTVEATARGAGLETNASPSAGDDRLGSAVMVRVLASIKAEPGPHPVQVSYTPAGGSTTVREVTVEVRVPIEVRPTDGAISLGPGESATYKVEVRREAGFDGEVEIILEGLPSGVRLAKGGTIGPGSTSSNLVLEMAPTSDPIAKPEELRVIGMARMPRGNVAVDSKFRPMIRARSADK